MTESKRENKNGNKRENKTEDRAGFGGPLYRKLREYGESDYYGFHMPGHKRQLGYFENPYKFDITEIDGFDDLHHSERDGVLTRADIAALERVLLTDNGRFTGRPEHLDMDIDGAVTSRDLLMLCDMIERLGDGT